MSASDPAIEEQFVGGLLLDARRALELARIAPPETLTDPGLRAILVAVVELAAAGSPVDAVTVGDLLRARGELAKAGGPRRLADLLNAGQPAFASWSARALADRSTLRRLADFGRAMSERAARTSVSVESAVADLAAELCGELHAITDGARRDDVQDAGAAAEQALAVLDSPTEIGVRTGVATLDALLPGGLRPGELAVLAAPTGMGKTLAAVQVALNVSEDGGSVLYATLEMPAHELGGRMLANMAGVDARRMREKRVSAEERAALERARHALGVRRLRLAYLHGATLASIREKARAQRLERGLDLLVVDHLHLMRHPGAETKRIEIAEISGGLKRLAGELGVPVLALAQLNRSHDRRGADRRPRLSDLRESATIEQDADVVAFIWEGEEPHKGRVRIEVEKHRHASRGGDWFAVDGARSRLSDAVPEAVEVVSL